MKLDHLQQAQTQQAHQAQKALQAIKPQQSRDELARAFLASWALADQAAEIAQADKKQKQEEQKKRQKPFTKEDYEGYNELDDILAEIDARLEKMLEIAQQMEAAE
jgi:hypothetical protein